MSEEILKALMQLFAIISKQDDGSTTNQREFVKAFLESQLNHQKVQEYLKDYDEKSEIIVIGGSAGSFNVVKRILTSLPSDFQIPIVLCLHRLREVRSGFAESLNIGSRVHVKEVHDKEKIERGIYLSPANYHVMIEPSRTFALSTEEDVNYSRPSIDITFESAGMAYKKSMAGILLSGTNSDGSRGLYNAYKNGAYTIIQDPSNAQFGIMPREALTFFKPHLKLNDLEIIEFVNSLVRVN